MESQIFDLIAKDGAWAILFVALLFYVLNILSKKIAEILTCLKETSMKLIEIEQQLDNIAQKDSAKESK